jgi:hypothetical protein
MKCCLRGSRSRCAATVISLLLLIFMLPGAAHARVVVNAETPIFIDIGEPGPLQKAADDLAADFQRVFGRPPRILHDPTSFSGTIIWIALNHGLPKQVEHLSGWERLHIQVVALTTSEAATHNAVVLTGSDLRGAIYSIYQFSQQFLGVDPFYWWTDHIPQRRTAVDLPEGFSLTEGPSFHYRGWFINDEDLLTGWRPGNADNTGISLNTWDHIFEAILRLKGDMVVPGTFTFPYEPQIRAAGQRGLIVTQHHVNTLGLNTWRWPSDKPMSYVSNRQLLESAWSRSVSQYPKDTETLWSVGFRGKNDQPFWSDDPDAPASDADRAKIIRAAIDRQIDIVHNQYPQAEFFMNAWGEAGDFLHEGLLKLPDSVTLIWTDDGNGIVQDDNKLASGQGVYYHIADLSNHYSEMVSPARLQRQLGRAATIGATRWLLLNTSNVRPVVMMTRAAMELAWNSDDWVAAHSAKSFEYLSKWGNEEFGERAAGPLADYYEAYFSAPPVRHNALHNSEEDVTASDAFYLDAAQLLLGALLKEKSDPKSFLEWWWWPGQFQSADDVARTLLNVCGAADERWTHAKLLAEKAKPFVRRERQSFFQTNVLTQVDLHLHFNRMLVDLARMVREVGEYEKITALRSAIAEGRMAVAAMHAAEYGKWKGFYSAGDWLLDTDAVLALANAYLDQIERRQRTYFTVPNGADFTVNWAYSRITAYQGSQVVQF